MIFSEKSSEQFAFFGRKSSEVFGHFFRKNLLWHRQLSHRRRSGIGRCHTGGWTGNDGFSGLSDWVNRQGSDVQEVLAGRSSVTVLLDRSSCIGY